MRWTSYTVPFRTTYTTSQGVQPERQGLLVELTADTGLVGLGEAAPTPEARVTGDALSQRFASMAASLVGLDIDAAFQIQPGLYYEDHSDASLACAVDTAVCDLLAQEREVPVARLLNGNVADRVEVNALVTAPDLLEAAKAATAARKAGFRTIKLKVGVAEEMTEECARVVAVRKAAGPDLKLRLDPNGAWDIATAMTAMRALEPLNIEYLEQPLPPGNVEAMAYLQARLNVPIAADEDVTDIGTAQRIIETGAARVLILKPQRLGGLRASLEVIRAAERAGIACVITTSIETGVGTAACLHLAAALPPGSPACGLATASLLENDLASLSIPVSGGAMRLPHAPGLAVQLDSVTLARYTQGWSEAS